MSNWSRNLYSALTATGPCMAYGAAAFAIAVGVPASSIASEPGGGSSAAGPRTAESMARQERGETGAASVVPEECVRPVSLAEGRMYERNDTIEERFSGGCRSVHYPYRSAVYFGFTLDRAAPVVIEMTSVDIDAWLILRSGTPPGGDLVLDLGRRRSRPLRGDVELDEDFLRRVEHAAARALGARMERVLDTGSYTIEVAGLGYGSSGSSSNWRFLDNPGDFTLKLMVDDGAASGVAFEPEADEAVFRDCLFCPEMVVVPAGTFQMGSGPDDDEVSDTERQRRSVTVGSFALGRYEVTRAEYAKFVEGTEHPDRECAVSWYSRPIVYIAPWPVAGSWRDPGFPQRDDHPVVCVNQEDAQAYVQWLSRETGEQYRRPSEAEWEYAALGWSSCKYANGLDVSAFERFYWIDGFVERCDDGFVRTAPVGSYVENWFKLHDMLGNVWEWTDSGAVHGGSWSNYPRSLHSASRHRPRRRVSDNIGFRVARTLD